ncbi:ABC-2 type transport system permease protein [Filimonas lacunae]|uniref:ABC-2 type transport system permease protein n=1 Tax=Filimonas lacunae TaxID=477680 RepID=A0A173MH74_9BACT|nr:Gldg family protein [Filimonas lacunae]BAV06945.1 ABC transporter protein [Filimonas lacunae]SIS97409.1 ABC-2 type transport system permease protein [Filimonas lacunae]
MKTILRVAKTELKLLFYSPIAWFLLVVFLIQCGVVYFNAIESFARTQELGGPGLRYMDALTNRAFLGKSGLFGSVMQNLFLYVPLLTMSLISRETGSGTIKLLYSSPVKVYQIILGKYLSMVVYSLLLVLVIGLFLVCASLQIVHPETGMLLTSLLGFFLLLCAYAAIGLFMSCLTTYQVVAAICTFVMIGILSYIGLLWQRIAFVRELTYFLSINGRTQKLLSGLITTKDLVYFLAIVYIFLGLSIYKLKAGMESKPALVKAGRYVAVVLSALLIGYVASIPSLTGYYDATFNKSRTVVPAVQKVLADLGDDPLEVTSYVNLLDQYAYLGGPDSYNDNESRWEHYRRFKSNIHLHKVSYYDSAFANTYSFLPHEAKNLKEAAEQLVKMNGTRLSDYLTPEQIQKQINLRSEDNRYVMQLKWKNKTTWLRIFDDQEVWPGETEVAAALKRLEQAKLPVIGFVTGNLERDINKLGDREYKGLTNLNGFRYSLVNQGFDVQTVSLETDEIPQGIAALVIADPRLALPPATLSKLQQYINNGGNLLIAGEPGRQDIVNPLLSQLGVQLTQGTVLEANKEEMPNKVKALLTPFAGGFFKPVAKAVADSLPVHMPGVAGVSWKPSGAFAVQPLLVTDAQNSWNRVKPYDAEMMTSGVAVEGNGAVAQGGAVVTTVVSGGGRPSPGGPRAAQGMDRDKLGMVSYSPADGDVKGPLTTAVSLTRNINGRQQRIVVAGDADFMSNKQLSGGGGKANFVFSLSIFSWLSYGEFPIDATRPDNRDKRVKVTLDDVNTIRTLFLWIIPALIVAFASVLLIRRKRR